MGDVLKYINNLSGMINVWYQVFQRDGLIIHKDLRPQAQAGVQPSAPLLYVFPNTDTVRTLLIKPGNFIKKNY